MDQQALATKTIIDVLQQAQGTLSVKEIRTAVWTILQIKFPDYYLSHLLRSLSAEGYVDFKQGRWVVGVNDKVRNTTPSHSVGRISYPNLSSLGIDALSGGSHQPNPISDSLEPAQNSVNESAQKILEKSGPWGKFRKLITYYKACIQNETGAEASAFLNEYGSRYLFYSNKGEWYPKAGRVWRHTISLTPHVKDFVKELGQLGESAVVVLGYPLQAVYIAKENEPDVALVRPVFQYHLQTRYANGALTLSCTSEQPEVCLDWLKYAFPSPEQQRNFLAACGLINSPRDDQGVENSELGSGGANLRVLSSTLSAFLSQKIRQALQINEINTEPLVPPFETGIYNKAVIMIGRRARFTTTLLNELSQIEKTDDATLDSTALRHIFRDHGEDEIYPKQNQRIHEACVVDTDIMNSNQRQSVADLMTSNLTVITGPPGTGKSQVVCNGIANLRLIQESTIFASRNHKAIDAVVNRFRDKRGRPLIVRANSKTDPSLKYTFATAIRDILASNNDKSLGGRKTKLKNKIDELLKKRGEKAEFAYIIESIRADLGELEEQLTVLASSINISSRKLLDEIPEKYPILTVKRIQKSIFNNSPDYQEHSFLDICLQRLKLIIFTPAWVLARQQLRFFKDLTNAPFFLIFYNTRSFHQHLSGLIQAAKYIEAKKEIALLINEIKQLPKYQILRDEIKETTQRISQLAQEALSLDIDCRIGLAEGSDSREKLSSLKIAMKAKGSGMVDDNELKKTNTILTENIPLLLKHFPSWAVTNLSIGSRLPLVAGMFDIAIIDEASQSDIPSAIPILFRAKRAAAVGDPHQLTHTSKLSVAKDTLLRKRVGLSKFEDLRYSYIDTSLYDLFAQAATVRPILLNYTYRSVDAIAQYSNNTFYNGQLLVGTDSSKLLIPQNVLPGINWTQIVGEVKSAGGGGCFCKEEIDSIIEFLCNILIDNKFQGTVGIVTPFRQQANRINDALYQSKLHVSDIEKAQVHVDTAHGFQGDEKDVMIFSLCAGPDMPAGSRTFLRETPNLFNVAVSRARAVLHVFGNRNWAERCGITHISNLTKPDQYPNLTPVRSQWHPHESPWEEILYKALLKKGLDPVPQYPVAGRRLDMALVKNSAHKMKIDIEVDGDRYHRNRDGSRKKDDIWRDIQLQGMGWVVVRFWVYQLREDLDSCVEKIVTLWSKNG